jgi:hypothetical protein
MFAFVNRLLAFPFYRFNHARLRRSIITCLALQSLLLVSIITCIALQSLLLVSIITCIAFATEHLLFIPFIYSIPSFHSFIRFLHSIHLFDSFIPFIYSISSFLSRVNLYDEDVDVDYRGLDVSVEIFCAAIYLLLIPFLHASKKQQQKTAVSICTTRTSKWTIVALTCP